MPCPSRRALDVRQPGHHRRPLFVEQPAIAIRPEDLPRHDHGRIAPPRGAVQRGHEAALGLRGRTRGQVGHHPARPLLGRQVTQPFGGEPGHVVEKRGRGDEDLPVAGPGGPLPRRAVGGNVAGVSAQAPDSRLVQSVDAPVAALEPARAGQIGVDDDAGQIPRGKLIGMPFDAHVAEAMRRVPGLEVLPRPSRRDDPVDLAGRQRLGDERQVDVEVRRGDVALGVDGFAVSQGDLGAARPEVVQPYPAVDVLTQVEHLPRGHPADRHRCELLHRPNRGRRRGDEVAVAVLRARDRGPACVVEPGVAPAIDPAPLIDGLPGDQVGRLDVRESASPVLPRPEDGDRTVLQLHSHLREEAQPVSPLIVRAR